MKDDRLGHQRECQGVMLPNSREIVTGDEQVEAVVIRFGDGEGPLTVELDGPS